MSAKGSTFSADLLKLIFRATGIANIADNAGSGPLANLYASLHTASPAGGDQTTSEAGYTGYLRVAVPRDNTGFDISGTTISPHADVVFATATGALDSETETYWAIGTASSGAGKLMYYGPLTPAIAVALGVTPRVKTTSTITEA